MSDQQSYHDKWLFNSSNSQHFLTDCLAPTIFILQYIGTFPVTLSDDGEKTLETHKERTIFVKEKLKEYRVSIMTK